jgi:outer membrane protein assembly factor BamD
MRNLLLLSLFVLISSCAVERPTGKTEAEVLFKEAQEFIKDKRYILATEKLNTLRSQYPYSFFATSAELMQADILFMQENYEEAAAAYILFKDFHPKSPKIDYVIYKIAESYYLQKPDTYDRDLSPAIKAIKHYNELKSLFPNSKYLTDADKKITICLEMLLNKEKYIANFYYKTEDFESAKFRYLNILRNITDDTLRSTAVERLVTIGKETKDSKLCRDTYSMYKSAILEDKQEKVQKLYFSCIKN